MEIALSFGVFLGIDAAGGGNFMPFFVVIVLAFSLAAINRGIARMLLGLIATGCVLGWTAGELRDEHNPPPYAGPQSLIATGTITSDPATTTTGLSAFVTWSDADSITRSSLVYWSGSKEVQWGDSITLRGEASGIDGGFIRASSMTVTSYASWLDQRRHAVRRAMASALLSNVPGSEGSLALGLVIGDDSGLPRDDEDDIRAAGLSHITAVSGWNVSLVIGSVGLAFSALRLRGWFWVMIQIVALATFVWIVGFDPPLTRAALMAVVVLAAGRFGRPSHGPTILALAAAVMLIVSPAAGSTLSFQLSVLAIGGLIAASHLVRADGIVGVVLKPLVATVAAGVLTAPLLAAEFGTASPVLLPANLIAGPLVALSTFAAIATLSLSWISPIAAIAGSVTWLLSHGVLLVARFAAGLPFGYVDFGPIGPSSVSLLYLVLAFAVFVALPEGRFAVRRLRRWTNDDPGPALLTSSSVAAIALVGMMALKAV